MELASLLHSNNVVLGIHVSPRLVAVVFVCDVVGYSTHVLPSLLNLW